MGEVTSVKNVFFCTRFGCFLWTIHLTATQMETEKEGRGKRWKQMKQNKEEEEDEKEWKWEEEERRPSASIHVNWWTSLPTVDCTELSPHWAHCTNPHYYSPHRTIHIQRLTDWFIDSLIIQITCTDWYLWYAWYIHSKFIIVSSCRMLLKS